MKTLYSLLTLLLSFAVSYSQNPSWLWTRVSTASGTNNYNEGWCVAADTVFDNAYIGGFIQGTNAAVVFGNDTLHTNGLSDLVIAKYTSAGSLLWAKNWGGTGNDNCLSIATDNSGNVYAVGIFGSPQMIAGNDTLINTTGAAYIYLLKVNAAGNPVWARCAGGISGAEARSVATDKLGCAYITGNFASPTLTFGSYTLTRGGSEAIYVAKYDSSGNVVWAKAFNSSNSITSYGIATDKNANIFYTGTSNGAITSFDAFTLNNAVPGSDLAFIVKMDSSGTVLWAKGSRNTGTAYGLCTAADVFGNCFMAGPFMYTDTVFFGPLFLTNTTNSSDVFLVKYDGNGNEMWARKGSGTGTDWPFAIAAADTGSVYITGGYSRAWNDHSSITFSGNTLPFPAYGYDPMFIVKYDLRGNVLCASSLNSGGDDWSGVAADNHGNAYVGGDYFTTPFIVGNDTIYSVNAPGDDEEFFLSKYRCSEETTGISDLNNGSEIQVYPNPSSGEITFINKTIEQNMTLTITDYSGRLVCEPKNLNREKSTLHLNVAAGLYLYTIQNTEHRYYGKLVIIDR